MAFLSQNPEGQYYVVAADLTTAITVSDDDADTLTGGGYATLNLTETLLASIPVRG
jgi:hypothetical protein